VERLEGKNSELGNEKNGLESKSKELEKNQNNLQNALNLRTGEIGQISGKLEGLFQQLGLLSLAAISEEKDMNKWFTPKR